MTKKLTIEKKPEVNGPATHTTELIIGTWKTWFGPAKTKLLLAEALNEWTSAHPKNLVLNGYLVTDYSVFLILKAHHINFHHLIAAFYEIVVMLIDRHHHHILKMNFSEDYESVNSKLLYQKPFERRIFFNDDLIRLMLGKEVRSTYYEFKLAHLISNIRHYNYCSAIDYSGAIGPVNIKLLRRGKPSSNK